MGFSVVDIQQPGISTYSKEMLGGREYNVYVLRKAQLYPQQTGKLEMEPVEVESEISFIRQEYLREHGGRVDELFDRFARSSIPPEAIIKQKVAVKSDPVTLDIKPLPEAKNRHPTKAQWEISLLRPVLIRKVSLPTTPANYT
jgi:hypothetical protein